MKRRITNWAAVGVLVTCLALLATAAAAGEMLHGTPIGRSRVSGALVEIAGESDTDDFVAQLIAGERLSVAVSGRDGLRPRLTLVDPNGLSREVRVASRKGGRRIRVSRHVVDTTGPWLVRIGGGATQGRYVAKFRVEATPPAKARGLLLGGTDPRTATHQFDATDGALLDVDIRWARTGASVEVQRIVTPTGEEHPDVAAALRPLGGRTRLRDLRLTGGAGTYTLVLGVADGSAEYGLGLHVDARRARPRGASSLAPDEPFLVARGAPLKGRAGSRVPLRGIGFSHAPRPQVFFGGRTATVASVSPHGLVLEVLPPPRPVGTLVDVAVVGSDGQAACRNAYFRYADPPTPPPPAAVVEVTDLDPGTATLAAGATQQFSVRLNRPAALGGAVVRVVVTGGVGFAPDPVLVPAGADSAAFDLRAGDAAAIGEVRVSLVQTATAQVTVRLDEAEDPVESLAEIDISGWTLRQTSSSASYRFPTGTVVTEGGYVVIARDASRSAFESHWNATLGDDVLFFDSADALPRINGSETYVLENTLGNTVDGPSIAMHSSAGRNLQRTVPITAAGESDAWSDTAATVTNATPGAGQPAPDTPTGIYVSEISDATGSGNYVFEFVELHFDGEPD